MQCKAMWVSVLGLMAWAAGGGAGLGAAQEAALVDGSISITVSNASPQRTFVYRQAPPIRQTEWQLYRLEFASPVVSELPQNNRVPADLYIPAGWREGQRGRPAVICLPILNGDEDLTAMMCTVLAARGMVAVTFKLPYYGVRGPAEGRRALAASPRAFVSALDQASQEIQRLVDLLQSRPEVDPARIGIAGISLGGIMSATAAGKEPRLQRAVMILAGGDLLTIVHHARETRQLSQMIQGLAAEERALVEQQLRAFDPLTHAPRLRERARQGRVLMLNAGQDEVIPRACTEKLAEALGIADKVVWFEGLGHYTALAELPRALRMMADFFAQDLTQQEQAPPQTASAASTNAYHRLSGVLQQLVTMATVAPGTGRCHYVEGELTGVDPQGRSLSGTGRIVIGHGDRFAFFMAAPGLGEWQAGMGEFPWVRVPVGNDGRVVTGTGGAEHGGSWSAQVDPQNRMKLALLQGVAASLAMAPDLLQRWVTAEFDREGWLNVSPKEPRYRDARLRIQFQADGRTPSEMHAEAQGFDVVFTVRGWQTNTVAAGALFEPDAGLPRREVDRSALLRDMAGVVNYVGDLVKVGQAAAAATNTPPLPRLNPTDFLQRYRQGQ
ncbi:prolyl oligopeptidase family serine peptidase [Fontisphaera persica]|uniref:alpha/beta hydrolase family protein n=1 Tax=Fontisphaera persica TaxID=2974023 RepID=UPI0024C0C75E|nr:dienelactone hydrolase family protein [Fontisphaera persica]WCJ60230.1 prolyl oligopeptidase family serine peptidase [Fontisphaera persica]